MITQIRTQSRDQLEERLRCEPDLFQTSAVVSCYPAASELPNNPNWLRIFFADTIANSTENIAEELIEENGAFNQAHAERIIDFVMAQHLRSSDVTLYINCQLGFRRSGAVAVAVKELIGLDDEQFRSDNPTIAPNPHVLNTLRAVARRRYASSQ